MCLEPFVLFSPCCDGSAIAKVDSSSIFNRLFAVINSIEDIALHAICIDGYITLFVSCNGKRCYTIKTYIRLV